MTTKHLVDPELAALLDVYPPIKLSYETLAQVRQARNVQYEQLRAALPPSPDIEVSERKIPSLQGQSVPDVRVLMYCPKKTSQAIPALLWVHGGGYVLGRAEHSEEMAKSFVSAVGCAVVVVDYRLAPETRHPGPVEDCYAVLKWLHTNANELGVDVDRLAIGGESAGGGMAAALALLARDRGEISLIFELLIYPMLDDRTVTVTEPHPYTGEYVWTPEANRFGWTALLDKEPGSLDISPYASAARAEKLEGLPATFIGVGMLDLFLEEDMEYARRLMRAGVPTELHVYPRAFHGFLRAANAKVAQDFARDQINALERAFKR